MKWHKLNARGAIVASTTAPDKATASHQLGGGTIVSDLSYRATATTTNTKGVVAQKPDYPALPAGHLWSKDAAAQVGLSAQRFLEITRRLQLTPGRMTRINGSRQMFYWSPEDIALVQQYHASRFSPARMAEAKAKRRASILYYHAKRWGWLDPKSPTPTTEPR